MSKYITFSYSKSLFKLSEKKGNVNVDILWKRKSCGNVGTKKKKISLPLLYVFALHFHDGGNVLLHTSYSTTKPSHHLKM